MVQQAVRSLVQKEGVEVNLYQLVTLPINILVAINWKYSSNITWMTLCEEEDDIDRVNSPVTLVLEKYYHLM